MLDGSEASAETPSIIDSAIGRALLLAHFRSSPMP